MIKPEMSWDPVSTWSSRMALMALNSFWANCWLYMILFAFDSIATSLAAILPSAVVSLKSIASSLPSAAVIEASLAVSLPSAPSSLPDAVVIEASAVVSLPSAPSSLPLAAVISLLAVVTSFSSVLTSKIVLPREGSIRSSLSSAVEMEASLVVSLPLAAVMSL